MIRAYGKSVAGRRPSNQDSIGLFHDLGVFVLADGLGGYFGGDVASSLAVDAVGHYFLVSDRSDAIVTKKADEATRLEARTRRLEHAVGWAQQRVVNFAHGKLASMGTTLVVVWIVDGRVLVAHVGDSRAYRLRAGVLSRLTMDHSVLAELRLAGNESLARRLYATSYASAVTRSLGRDSNPRPDLWSDPLESGDVFLLCSDGLTEGLEDGDIERILRTTPVEEAADVLVDQAYLKGSSDNISAIVVRWDQSPGEPEAVV